MILLIIIMAIVIAMLVRTCHTLNAKYERLENMYKSPLF